MNDLKYYFQILEIPQDASYEEAKAAYRDLVDVWHPDRYGRNTRLQVKATEKIKQINSAWHHLDAYYRAERTDPGETADNRLAVRTRCPKCSVINKIPLEKAAHPAQCGACGTSLPRESAEKQVKKRGFNGSMARYDRKTAVSITELAAGVSVGLIVMLILFLMKNTLF